MNQQLFVNNFSVTLAAAVSAAATVLPLASGSGAKLPALANGDYLNLTLTQAGTETSWEVVSVTAISGDNITVTRQVEGAAAAWAAGDKAACRQTAAALNALTSLIANPNISRSSNSTTNIGSFNIASNFARSRAKKAAVRANTSDMKILMPGDSTTMGAYALGVVATDNCRRASSPAMFASLINNALIPANTDSFFGDNNTGAVQAYDSNRVVPNSGWGSSSTVKGLTGKALTNASGTNPLYFSPYGPCDTFDVYYQTGSGLPSFTMARGADPVSAPVVTAGGVGIGKATYTTSVLTGPFMVTPSGTGLLILGIVGSNSTQKAVQVINAGWSAGKMEDWSDDSTAASALNILKFLQPDLTWIQPGINNWNAPTDVPTFQSNLDKYVKAALISGDVIINSGYPSSIAAPYATQRAFCEAMRAVALANPGVMFNDLHQRWRSYEEQIVWYANTLHPLQEGYRQRAQGDAAIWAAI